MATKKCPNGHQYDQSIYGDKCPFCPSETTVVNNPVGQGTAVVGGDMPGSTNVWNDNPTGGPTIPVHGAQEVAGGHTVFRPKGATGVQSSDTGRKTVGMLVSYNTNPNGDVFKIVEGRNVIGRAATCDIPVISDSNMSSNHLMILYREDGFTAVDQYSTNGTYINGEFLSEGRKLQTGDVIVVGATKFMFFAIPNF